MPSPCDPEISVAAIISMRSREDLLRILLLPPNKRIGKKRLREELRYMFESYANGETVRKQNLSRHAVHIPGVPAAGETHLHCIVFTLFLCRGKSNRKHQQPSG